jgi:hypothetical protein
MRSLLLFIGSCLYPFVMVIISPVIAFLYFLLGTVVLTRFVKTCAEAVVDYFATLKFPVPHFSVKKQFSFLPKIVRWH